MEYLDIVPAWVKRTLHHFEKVGNDVVATFAIEIPHEVKVKKGFRLSRMAMAQSKSLISEKDIIFWRG